MYLRSLKLTNLLSFGPDSQPIELGPLNVLIGPNGSGKSNLIEAIGLLAAMPTDLPTPIRQGGGIREWAWKGASKSPVVTIDTLWDLPDPGRPPPSLFRHMIAFSEVSQRLEIVDERIEDAPVGGAGSVYFGYKNSRPVILFQGEERELAREDVMPDQSILRQRRGTEVYRAITLLADMYDEIRLYQQWDFGRNARLHGPQPTDLPNDYLTEDAGNLGLILNQIRANPEAKEVLLKNIQMLFEGVSDMGVRIEGGTVQVFLQENKWVIPATRLSDGTLRWLALLCILLNPNPQFIVCIEEPELGLHPDLLPSLADLLRQASDRMQLIVTTHSDVLVDALSETPEAVLVCEKAGGTTTVRRLNRKDLSEWLKKYSLGELWRSGEIGGNRW